MLYDDRNLYCKQDINKLTFCNSFMVTTAVLFVIFMQCAMVLESTKLPLRFPIKSTQYSPGVDKFLEFAYRDILADTMTNILLSLLASCQCIVC